MSKPIKLLLSLSGIRALYAAADFVLYGDYDASPTVKDFDEDALQDVCEVLQQTIKDADEDALIAAVLPEPVQRLAFISKRGTSPVETVKPRENAAEEAEWRDELDTPADPDVHICALSSGVGEHSKEFTQMKGGPLDGHWLCNTCIENLGGPVR